MNNLYLTEPQVRIVTTFDSPRDRVFDAWVRPELLEQWFAPVGCTMHVARMDVRPGGGFHWAIRNPAFGDCWTIGTYLEIVRPERIIYTWAIADAAGNRASPESQGHDPAWPPETVVRVSFEERPSSTSSAIQTLVTLEQDVSEALAKRTGAYPSWIEMLEALERHLAGRSV